MELLKTEKTQFSTAEIESYITEHERPGTRVESCGARARTEWLWQYYKGKNKKILERKAPDPNNPDNRTPVSYGRKIVTTFTGYAYRPKYITYGVDEDGKTAYLKQLQATFDLSREHIRTSRAGRNTGIFGYAYELLYIDRTDAIEVRAGNAAPTLVSGSLAEPRFISVDPWEIILLYDFSSEPQKQIGLRYYRITDDHYKVEQYTREVVLVYDRRREKDNNVAKWVYTPAGQFPNYFGDVPIVAYYMGDERLGVIEPVLDLIDGYDLLVSDSFNEFDRFAHAYLVLKKMSLIPPDKQKEPGAIARALEMLKRRRVFENVPDITEPIKFLTKDIPTQYVEFMTKLVKEQIHQQSHVPDFKELATGTLSGAAIQRLLFDFENVVSSAEADFDEGLKDRIRLINVIYAKAGRPVDDTEAINIQHKRNMPDDLKDFADTALVMKSAGFSRRLVAEIMPDSVVPNVDKELEQQDEDRESAFPDVDADPGEPMTPDQRRAAMEQ